jgi:hypothetical protein
MATLFSSFLGEQMKRLLLLSFATMAASFATADQYGPGAGGTIPDSNPTGFSSTIIVADAITTVQSVEIRGLRHTWIGDLIITLTAPGGQSVDILRRVGSATVGGLGDSSNLGTGGGSVGATYIFDDSSSNSIWTAAAGGASTFDIPAGTYSPATNLFTGAVGTSYAESNFTFGDQAAGNWVLKISDNAGADLGAYTEWFLNATPQVVPEPATMAVLGVGALALIRRRRAKK